MGRIIHRPGIISIPQFCSHAACDQFIALGEGAGFEAATVETEKGQQVLTGVRNNERALFSDKVLAADLWVRLWPHMLERLGNSIAVGLNELFRIYRYGPGQEFRKHRDQSFIRNEREASYYTFMIYLNDDYAGGETSFDGLLILPQRGSALIFDHRLEHAGKAVVSGCKYVLRSDVMYRLDAVDPS